MKVWRKCGEGRKIENEMMQKSMSEQKMQKRKNIKLEEMKGASLVCFINGKTKQVELGQSRKEFCKLNAGDCSLLRGPSN